LKLSDNLGVISQPFDHTLSVIESMLAQRPMIRPSQIIRMGATGGDLDLQLPGELRRADAARLWCNTD
jgi:hypothetical protein